jgi:PAS domain S-box-containing protein
MAPGNGRTLLALDDALFPLAGPLPVAVAKDAAQGAAPPPGKAAERRLEAGGTMVDFLLVSIPVEPTRFRLMSYVPARDVTGPLSPGGLLLSTLLLCAVITGGGALLLVSRHRNLAQQEEHREFVRTIFEGIGAAIFVFDPREGLMTDCNATAERLLSMPRERLVGRRDAPEIALAGKRRRNLLQPDEKDSGIYEEGKLHLPERTVPVSWRLFGVHIGGKGRLVQVVFDITERRDLERRLNVAQKLESIGLLASGIAHEINTPIQYIGDSVRFAEDAFRDLDGLFSLQERRLRLLARGEDDPALAEEAERRREDADLDFLRKETPRACSRALEGVDRVASIVSAMRNFSHPGADAKAPVDINHAVRTTVTVARNEWKYVAEMELNLAPDLPLVMALAGGVNQVLLNIIVNAAHAIGELGPQADGGHGKGVITITTAREADMVAVTIRDTGRGIPEENLHKVFDPFFTTKAVGKGTGQGLAIVHDIVVDKHGGTIDVDSAPGRGTAFTLRLPIEGTEDDRSRA